MGFCTGGVAALNCLRMAAKPSGSLCGFQANFLINMKTDRRCFLQTASVAGAVALVPSNFVCADSPNIGALEKEAERPVLDVAGFREPIIIESVELLRKGREYFVRVR